MTQSDSVAIIGIACRLPGEAVDLEKFWQVLSQEGETCTEIPDQTFNIERYCKNGDERLHPVSKTTKAHFLKDPIDEFDAEFFGISRKEAASMDPQHRLLLQSTYHAMEDAGLTIDGISGTNTAVYVGVMQSHYHLIRNRDAIDTCNQYSYMNTSIAYSAARLSYFFNLTGPAFALDTMCSSSMIALHLGVQSLKNGESDMAFAAGVNLNFDPQDFIKMSVIGAAAPDGRSKAFSANADGYAKGDGVGVVILKKLDKAIRDGDRIHAVIRGTGVNHDGKRKNGITVTSSIGQKELFERVYAESGVDPKDVYYLESHTTGTLVGDPIEASALGSFFGKARRDSGITEPVRIGSVKANIGHTEAMSGIASVAKVLMMMKKRTIPATVLFDQLNPKIDFNKLNLKVITETEPLPAKALVGASSFGMGGTNGHIILESYEQERKQIPEQSGYLLFLSAKKSEEVLKQIAQNLKNYVNEMINNGSNEKELFTDICYTSAIKRTHHEVRASIAFKDLADFNAKIDAFVASEKKLGIQSATVADADPESAKPKTVFVFSGQGPQWFAMGRQLYTSEPVFRKSMERIDKELSKYVDWSLVEELMTKDDATTRINQTDFAQPGIFAIQVSIYELLKSLSITPDIVVGHSVGEVASAYVSGALTFEDAVQVIYERSRLQHACSFINKGKMLAVNISEAEAKLLISGLEDKLSIAAVNSATSVTISGDEEALKQVVDIINNNSKLAKASKVYLRTSAAFHSVHMDPIKDELLSSIKITPQRTTIPLFSTVTGDLISGLAIDAEYWWKNVRQAVLFEQAITSILSRYDNVTPLKYWIEISPHPVLAAPLKSIVNPVRSDAQILSTFIRKEDENITIRNTLGGLYVHGYENISWNKVFTEGSLISLPLYPFQKQRFWLESLESLEERTSAPSKYHPLLGSRKLPVHGPQPIWVNHISLSNAKQEFLKDHQIQGSIIFPFAGYIEQVVAALCEYHKIEPDTNISSIISLKNFHVGTAMVLKPDEVKIVETILNPSAKTFLIVSKNQPHESDLLINLDTKGDFSSKWVTHAFGQYEVTKGSVTYEDEIGEIKSKTESKEARYDCLYDRGLMYGPAFQGIEVAAIEGDDLKAIITPPHEVKDDIVKYIVHPSMVDCCFQAILSELSGKQTMVPVHMKQMNITIGSSLYGLLATPDQQIATTARFHKRVVGNTAAVKQQLDLKILTRTDKGLAATITIEEFCLQEIAGEDEEKAGVILTRSWERQEREVFSTLTPVTEVVSEVQKQELSSSLVSFRDVLVGNLQRLSALYALTAIRALVGEQFSFEQLRSKVVSNVADKYIRTLLVLLEKEQLATLKDNVYTLTDQRFDLHAIQYVASQYIQQNKELQSAVELVSLIGLELESILSGAAEYSSLISKNQDILNATRSKVTEILPSLFDSLVKPLKDSSEQSRLRVLQLGSGTGEATTQILELLKAIDESKIEYVLTDASEENIAIARGKFDSESSRISIAVLDLESIQYSENIQPESFDVVLVTSDIVTSDIKQYFKTVKALLVPNGSLIALQSCPHSHLDFIYGVSSSWWNAEKKDLSEALKEVGFTQVVAHDHASLTEVVVANKQKAFEQYKWILFADESGVSSAVSQELVQLYNQSASDIRVVKQGTEFAQNGSEFTIDVNNVEHYRTVFEGLSADTKIIYAWALDIPQFADKEPLTVFDKQEEICYSLSCLVNALDFVQRIPQFFVLTAGAQSVASAKVLNITQTPVVGFMHSAAAEYFNKQSKLIDIDADVPILESASTIAAEIILNSRNRHNEVRLSPTARLALFYSKEIPRPPSQDQVRSVVPETEPANFRVAVPESRLLRDVFFEQIPRPEPVDDQVEVKIHASAINFKDILKIRSLHPITVNHDDDAVEKELDYCNLIGLEAAGTISKLGPNARTDLKIGDRVVYYSVAEALFKSYSIQPSNLVVKIPDNLTFEQAASVPIVFMTAYYCLFEKTKLKKGQSVLIHCASGGVGLAAIQLCKNAGAEIFVTAGTDKKRQFLKEVVGVEHVFSSRNTKFYDEILKITNGKGVDMIINSLSGDMLLKSLDLLATSGHFFELGKRDIFDNRHINLYKLRDNCAFHIIDLEIALLSNNSREGVIMLEEAMRQYAEGIIKPIQVQSFEIADVKEAFELHQKATSIGKLVLNFNSQKPIHVVSHGPSHVINERTGTYIITGGTGGVGLSMCKWFIKNKNVKNILLLSRRVPAPDVQEQVTALNRRGVTVRVVNADVTEFDQIKSVIEQINADPQTRPLRGVIHSAAVIEDALSKNMPRELINKVLRPKIRGAFNLHVLTKDLNLEFFTLTGSMSNVMALVGQTHYNAANNFLDALAAYRTKQGLAGMSVSLSAVGGAGFVARNKHVARLLEAGGVVPVHVDEVIEWVETLQNAGITLPVISHKNFVKDFKGTYVPSGLERVFAAGQAEVDEEDAADAQASSSETVLSQIHNFIAQVLGSATDSIPVDKSLNQLGFDSLMSVEVRNWVASKFKFNVPLVELLQESVISLSQKIGAHSGAKKQGASASSAQHGAQGTDKQSHEEEKQVNRLTALYTVENPSSRLICFPYMGGSSLDYKNWPEHLPSDMEVYTIDYLLNVDDNESIYDWSVLIELLYDEIRPLLLQQDVPCFFYGHSLGGNVAFECIRYLGLKYNVRPAHLFVGGIALPGAVNQVGIMYKKLVETKNIDNATLQTVIDNDYLPGVKFDTNNIESSYETIKKLIFMPKFLSEFKLRAKYDYTEDHFGPFHITVPITVFSGTNDKLVFETRVESWGDVTTESEFVYIEGGDHLFMNDPAGLQVITTKITNKATLLKATPTTVISTQQLQKAQQQELIVTEARKLKPVSSGEDLRLIEVLTNELESEKTLRIQLELQLQEMQKILKQLTDSRQSA